MRVTSLSLQDFRSFESATLEFDRINVFVGRNNAGKSAILQALYAIQTGAEIAQRDVRKGTSGATIIVGLSDLVDLTGFGGACRADSAKLIIRFDGANGQPSRGIEWSDGQVETVGEVHGQEPHHFFVPFFNRRPPTYQEDVRTLTSDAIWSNWQNLPARLDRLTNRVNPASEALLQSMRRVVGVEVTAIASNNGKAAGTYVTASETVTLDRMGAGVANAVTILSGLAEARGKGFLIEEPENDLHPAALKELLAVIEHAAGTNQLFISTHSQVVLRHLGSLPGTRIFRVALQPTDGMPTSNVEMIEPTPLARREVLAELGYELSDYDLYDGWLILEESSAERIIRDYLIKWFAPGLVGRLRTVSTQGVNDVEPTFHDFRRLFLYAHLEGWYKERAWVMVDGGAGEPVIASLRSTFSTWPADHFIALEESDFECYYPAEFSARAAAALDGQGSAKREAKRLLLNDVRAWADADEARARDAFAVSAAEVVRILQAIETKVMGR